MSVRTSSRRSSGFVEKVARERVGRILRGKWTLEQVIGIGGMAAVYRATHRNGARVAVKMLHPALSASATLCERFVREGYVANRVAHPRVPRVLDDDVETTDGSAFLVMELIDGITLEERAGSCKPGDGEILRVARDVLQILVAAHEKSVIHRDLKPDNLMIDQDGRVHVLDFGIARLLDADDTSIATTTGAAFGTPAFLAPEQAVGRRDLISGATDIYGLGATLFTLASDEFVHASQQAQELVLFAATRRARSIVTCAPQLSRGVAAMIDRATQYDPRDRFRTAAEMLREVERLTEARAASDERSRADGVGERPSSSQNLPAVAVPVRKTTLGRGASIAIAASAMLSAGAIGLAFRLGETQRAPRDEQRRGAMAMDLPRESAMPLRAAPPTDTTRALAPLREANGDDRATSEPELRASRVQLTEAASDITVLVGTPVAISSNIPARVGVTPAHAGLAHAATTPKPAKKPIDLGY